MRLFDHLDETTENINPVVTNWCDDEKVEAKMTAFSDHLKHAGFNVEPKDE